MSTVEVKAQEYRGTCLFDGNDLRLVVQDHGAETVFLTFTPRPDIERNKGFQKLGFAQKFVEKYKYSGVYIIAKWAHWYQTPELAQVEDIIRGLDFFKAAQHRIAYGTSMGAFAVLLCSQRLGCQQAIAVAPQVSMKPSIVRFETRWSDDVRKIDFIEPDARSGMAEPCRYYVVYDRFYAPDRQHIDLLWHYAVTRLDLPFSGHNLLDYALQTGLSDDFLNSFASPSHDPVAVFTAMRGRRHATTNFYEKLYQICLQRGKIHYSGIVARRWYDFDRASSSAFRKYAKYLRDDQRHDEALELGQTYLAAGGDTIAAHTVIRDSLYSLQRYEESLAANEVLLREQPDDYAHVHFVLTALRRLQDNDGIVRFCEAQMARYNDRSTFLRAFAEALEQDGQAVRAREITAMAEAAETPR